MSVDMKLHFYLLSFLMDGQNLYDWVDPTTISVNEQVEWKKGRRKVCEILDCLLPIANGHFNTIFFVKIRVDFLVSVFWVTGCDGGFGIVVLPYIALIAFFWVFFGYVRIFCRHYMQFELSLLEASIKIRFDSIFVLN